MRSVVLTEPGVMELNYTWLPTWLGMNSRLKADIEQALSAAMVGIAVDEEALDKAHDLVVDFLVERFPHIEGLKAHLDSLYLVSYK